MSQAPGRVRDSIIEYLERVSGDVSLKEIVSAVSGSLGGDVPQSSVRSYLNLNTPGVFERTARGRYQLKSVREKQEDYFVDQQSFDYKSVKMFRAECFEWISSQKENSIHAVVTDPPYGLVEYSEKERKKLASGRGGVWRIPPSFDGHRRSPLPRFTTLSEEQRSDLRQFFKRLAVSLNRVLVPGANVVVASNPLLFHLVAEAMADGGLEMRGAISRLTMTMRGGDRPKNAHHEFRDVSVMPRSMWEPWVVLRKPVDGRIQDNLRKWGVGGFRRPDDTRPFGDVIRSSPTPAREKKIAPHPSLKPQAFMRQVVRGVLPLGEGVILDPFAGAGSTLAAAAAIGYKCMGVELVEDYFCLARDAVPKLSKLDVRSVDPM